VVIVTGYGTKANEERAKAAGVSGFLNKPLSPEMIEESVAHALLKPETAVVAQTHAVAAEQVHPEPAEKTNTLRNIALFLAAPFIGLAYAVMLPFVGIAMLAWVGGKALLNKARAI
jgi:DNA-binding NarL/FixJ family response regulator